MSECELSLLDTRWCHHCITGAGTLGPERPAWWNEGGGES